jgi:hypothetical protein
VIFFFFFFFFFSPDLTVRGKKPTKCIFQVIDLFNRPMFRLSRLVGLTLLLALVGQAASFLNFKNAPPPPPLQRVAPLQPPQGDGAVSRPQQPPSRRAQLWALEAEPAEPNMMEEGIYNFNKLVIDSVYDLICLLYNKNDLSKNSIAECTARFYVLETVARVPYFAYLSVMVSRISPSSLLFSPSP